MPDDPAKRRRLIVAAEVLLVVLLVVVNVALWNRSSTPPAVGEPASRGTLSPDGAGSSTASSTTSRTAVPTTVPTASTTSGGTSGVTGTGTGPGATAPGDADVVDAAATGDALRRAGRVILAIDASSGMKDALPQVSTAMADLVRQAPDGTTVGVLVFSASGATVLAPPAPVTATRKDALAAEIEALRPAVAPGRPLFDAMLLGYQNAVTSTTLAERPLLVVVTNGGRQGGTDLQTLATFINAEKTRRPTVAYPLIVAVGPSADSALLEQAAAQSGGRVVSVERPDQVRAALFSSLASTPITSTSGKPS